MDEVYARVLERLAPDAARAVVVEVVSEMAERLVREEIARIEVGSRQSSSGSDGRSAGSLRCRHADCLHCRLQ